MRSVGPQQNLSYSMLPADRFVIHGEQSVLGRKTCLCKIQSTTIMAAAAYARLHFLQGLPLHSSAAEAPSVRHSQDLHRAFPVVRGYVTQLILRGGWVHSVASEVQQI